MKAIAANISRMSQDDIARFEKEEHFLLTGEKTGLPESADGWILSAAFAVMVCCAAMTLFKKATQLIGPQMAGILSTFEPLTGIVAGVLFLGESFGPIQFAGSLLILSSVILLSLRH